MMGILTFIIYFPILIPLNHVVLASSANRLCFLLSLSLLISCTSAICSSSTHPLLTFIGWANPPLPLLFRSPVVPSQSENGCGGSNVRGDIFTILSSWSVKYCTDIPHPSIHPSKPTCRLFFGGNCLELHGSTTDDKHILLFYVVSPLLISIKMQLSYALKKTRTCLFIQLFREKTILIKTWSFGFTQATY